MSENEEKGIKNLTKMSNAVIELADIGGDIYDDKKFNANDLDDSFRVIPVGVSITSAIPYVPAEFRDLDEVEVEEWKDSIKAKVIETGVDPESDILEELVADAMSNALDYVKSVNNSVKFARKIKSYQASLSQ